MSDTNPVQMPPRAEVGSQLLKGIAYDPASQTLEVQFKKSDAIYRYSKVAPDSYARMMGADSIGSHFLKNIKDAHPYTRVTEDASHG